MARAWVDLLVILAVVALATPWLSSRDAPPPEPPQERLFASLKAGDDETARALLAGHPQLLHSTDMYGRTALHWAAMLGRASLTQTLLERGAPVLACSSNGNTPLHLAALGSTEAHLDIGRLLLQAGAQPRAANRQGKTPLSNAEDQGTAAMVSLLRGGP